MGRKVLSALVGPPRQGGGWLVNVGRGGVVDRTALISVPPPTLRSPFMGPKFVLGLVGIQRRVVQITAIERDDLLPL